MKLQHYLGGLDQLGPVSTEINVFVEPWEKRIFGIHAAMMALSNHLDKEGEEKTSSFKDHWTWAHLRTGAEGMNPFDYFKYRYYEKWLGGISSFFIEKGYISQSELDELTEHFLNEQSIEQPLKKDAVIDKRIYRYLVDGDSPKRPATEPFRFVKGDSVTIANPPTIDHTKLPGFLRQQEGKIEYVYDGYYNYLVPIEEDNVGPPMAVYCVKFDPKTIWPNNTENNFYFYADLYEAYIK